MNPMKQAIMKRRMKLNGGDLDCEPGMTDGEENQEEKEEQEQAKASGLAPEREESGESEEEMESEEGSDISGEYRFGSDMSKFFKPTEEEMSEEMSEDMPDEEMLRMAEMLYDKDHAGKPSIMGRAADKMKLMLSKKRRV